VPLQQSQREEGAPSPSRRQQSEYENEEEKQPEPEAAPLAVAAALPSSSLPRASLRRSSKLHHDSPDLTPAAAVTTTASASSPFNKPSTSTDAIANSTETDPKTRSFSLSDVHQPPSSSSSAAAAGADLPPSTFPQQQQRRVTRASSSQAVAPQAELEGLPSSSSQKKSRKGKGREEAATVQEELDGQGEEDEEMPLTVRFRSSPFKASLLWCKNDLADVAFLTWPSCSSIQYPSSPQSGGTFSRSPVLENVVRSLPSFGIRLQWLSAAKLANASFFSASPFFR
jgi:hypothetical protein